MITRTFTGDWETVGRHARPIRFEVFVVEQGVPEELEWDDMDAMSIHAIAFDGNGKALGTGRLLPDGHLGRMAVRKAARRRGVGAALLHALIQCARKRGDKTIVLHAQTHAEQFYLKHGFRREGAEFMEAGIPHVAMRLDL